MYVLQNRPDSDQMFPRKPPWTAHAVSHRSLVRVRLSTSAPFCSRSHQADPLHPGRGSRGTRLRLSVTSKVFCFFFPSRRLMELHACLRLKQRHRQACLNALRFCHNGRAFGGFAHLLQRINLSILHNAALLPNPSINISPL